MDLEKDRRQREQAWLALRLALRAYLRAPSADNLERMVAASRSVQTLEERALGRPAPEAALPPPGPGTPPARPRALVAALPRARRPGGQARASLSNLLI